MVINEDVTMVSNVDVILVTSFKVLMVINVDVITMNSKDVIMVINGRKKILVITVQ